MASRSLLGRSDRGHARLRHHRRGTGGRGRGLQGSRARTRRSRSSIGAGSAGAARTSAACRRSRCSHDAARHHANEAAYEWPRASAHRDFMINRAADARRARRHGHMSRRSTKAGAVVYRGSGAITGRGRVAVRHDDATHELAGTNIVIAVGSVSKRPTDRGPRRGRRPGPTSEATLARELPRSLVVLGGGPTGCELAQVYARFGVPTTIVQSGPRLAPTDHPRNSEVLRATLEADGVTVRTGVRALRARAGGGPGRRPRHRARRRLDRRGPRRPARGRARVPARRPRARALRHRHVRADAVPARRAAADRRRPVGHRRPGRARSCTPTRRTTRARSRSGWRSARRSMPDYRALPRATYTDPEASSVGLTLEEALEPRSRRVRAGRRLRQEHAGLRARGQDRARHDRGRPRARASWSARRWPAPTRRRRSTSACWRSRPGSRSTSWPTRSTPSRRPRGSSTACSPTPSRSWTRRVRRVGARRPVRSRRRPARP